MANTKKNKPTRKTTKIDDNTNRALGLLEESMRINNSLVDMLRNNKTSTGFVDAVSEILSLIVKLF